MTTTGVFILAMIILIAVFDVWIIKKKGKHESISAHIIRKSKEWPMMTLIVGILIGHLFWNMRSVDFERPDVMAKKCKAFLQDYATRNKIQK